MLSHKGCMLSEDALCLHKVIMIAKSRLHLRLKTAANINIVATSQDKGTVVLLVHLSPQTDCHTIVVTS